MLLHPNATIHKKDTCTGTIIMYLPTIAFVLLVCLYWIYKKIRAPLYKPGMVSSWFRTNPEAFDDESLYSQGTTTTWRMPHNVDLFFFPPPIQTSTSPRPVLAIHGGPSIPPSEPWKLCEKIANVYLYHARGCGPSPAAAVRRSGR